MSGATVGCPKGNARRRSAPSSLGWGGRSFSSRERLIWCWKDRAWATLDGEPTPRHPVRQDATVDADLLERCRRVAERFVSAGRVVPGLTVDGQGRARSWWWP